MADTEKPLKVQGYLKSHAQKMNAAANLLREQRLARKQQQLIDIAKETAKVQSKLPKTGESLTSLGAGTEYGSRTK